MIAIQKVYAVMPFVMWGYITSALPMCGFIACVIIAATYHSEQSTRTHCGVWNILPSISAAVGDSTPERYIWRFCIAYHTLPRTFIITSIYFAYYAEIAAKVKSAFFSAAYKIAVGLNILENLCLVLLTFVSSRENYSVHEKSFITFMACATIYMFLTLYLQNVIRKVVGFTPAQSKAFKIKLFACGSNVSVFIISIYLFIRHNSYCEPGVYSWYALCEYYIVLSNIAFHSAAMVAFPNVCAVIAEVDSTSKAL